MHNKKLYYAGKKFHTQISEKKFQKKITHVIVSGCFDDLIIFGHFFHIVQQRKT